MSCQSGSAWLNHVMRHHKIENTYNLYSKQANPVSKAGLVRQAHPFNHPYVIAYRHCIQTLQFSVCFHVTSRHYILWHFSLICTTIKYTVYDLEQNVFF